MQGQLNQPLFDRGGFGLASRSRVVEELPHRISVRRERSLRRNFHPSPESVAGGSATVCNRFHPHLCEGVVFEEIDPAERERAIQRTSSRDYWQVPEVGERST